MVFPAEQTQHMQKIHKFRIIGLSLATSIGYKGHVLQFTRQHVVDQQWQHTVFGLSKATSNMQFETHEGHQKASDLPKSHEFVEVFKKQRV